MADELAKRNDLGPLTENHWKIIEFVRDYYLKHGEGPAIIKIGKATGFTAGEICSIVSLWCCPWGLSTGRIAKTKRLSLNRSKTVSSP